MWIKSLQIQNVKSFEDSRPILFSKGINLLVGRNNSGKTSILRALYGLQNDQEVLEQISTRNIRKGAPSYQIQYYFGEAEPKKHFSPPHGTHVAATDLRLVVTGRAPENRQFFIQGNGPLLPSHGVNLLLSNQWPKNWIFPFLANRKPLTYSEVINLENDTTIREGNNFAYSRVDSTTSDTESPECLKFFQLCESIFGFKVRSYQIPQGKRAGLIRSQADFMENIAISDMGEGGKSLLDLLIGLCRAKDNLFLIEEPENDVHPLALKHLLDFIKEKAETNQFIISTHSNIVTKVLGSHPNTKLFSLKLEVPKETRMPTSRIEALEGDDVDERRMQLLADLGYDLSDFDLYKGYLITEESTAERIIRDFLIPELFPKLRDKLKTISAGGTSDLVPRVSDFMRVFVFVHKAPAYKDKAWVIADSDETGLAAIIKLKEKFENWHPSHFVNLKQTSFEYYYPPTLFGEDVKRVLDMPHGKAKMDAKGDLAVKVLKWALANSDVAKEEFKKSAGEVIEFLRKIEESLLTSSR
jgi:hypothetical protein